MIEQIFIIVFLSLGTFFMFVAALGVFRLPDVYNQLHALTKAGTLGLVNLMLATIIMLDSMSVLMTAILIIAFQFITAPVSAHMISRVQHPHAWGGTIMDETEGEPLAGLGEEDVVDSVVEEEAEDSDCGEKDG